MFHRGKNSISFAVTLLAVVASGVAFGQSIIPDYSLDVGEGFTDSTATTSPISGLPSTLGADRRASFEAALAIWEGLLDLAVDIRIEAAFDDLGGTGSSAILGVAGPRSGFVDFPSAPIADTLYVGGHADQLAGMDLSPGNPDIDATFNSEVDGGVVLGSTTWYYGIDGNPPGGTIDFLSTALHEICHGLGFLSGVTELGVWQFGGVPDIYSSQLREAGGLNFVDMSDAQRAAVQTSVTDLVWKGAAVVADQGGVVTMYAPTPYEDGSSTSHWDTSNFPNLLMEPFATESFTNATLEFEAFDDMGWPLQTGSPTFQFTKSQFVVFEGDGTAIISVNLSPASTIGSVSVSYASESGGSNPATEGDDYTDVSDTLTWAMNESGVKTFTIPVAEDVPVELSETVDLTLSSPTGDGVLGAQSTATLIIIDPDALPLKGFLLAGLIGALLCFAGAFTLRERKS